jgi:hypothetical protein
VRCLTVAIPIVAALLVLVPAASADLSLCPPGSGAGQCTSPHGLAVDTETGRLYVADSGNHRIDVFEASGEFLFAFGWKVNATTPEEKLQTCTTASGCQAGTAGPGAGQLSGTTLFIAVDNGAVSPSRHDVYLGEDASHRVQKFDAAGKFLRTFGKGVNTGTSGEADICTNAGAPSDVCGTGTEGFVAGGFKEMKGIGVSGAGAIYVADDKEEGECAPSKAEFKKRAQRFDEAGHLIGQSEPADAPCGAIASSAFAVDPGGDFYLANEGSTKAIRKYEPVASPTALCGAIDPGTETRALGTDGAGDLFAGQREVKKRGVGSYRMITELDPACNYLRRFAYGASTVNEVPLGMAAFHSGEGDVFLSPEGSEKGILYLSLPPKGPVIPPPSVEANPVSNTKATLGAEVNPEGSASTYHFEYVEEATYLHDIAELGAGHGFDHAVRVPPSPAEDPSAGSDFSLHGAELLAGCPDPITEIESGTCLAPETRYRFQAVATNADGEGNTPIEGPAFETKKSLEFGELWSTEAGVDSVVLHGEVDPLGVPASGHFEYVDDATFQESGFEEATQVPAEGEAQIDFGAGEVLTARSATLSSLSPNTLYHYRLVAEDRLIEPIASEKEPTFKTFALKEAEKPCPENEAFRSGPSALLPDCRAYEMVSPLQKNNGDIIALPEFATNVPAVLVQSSTSGQRLSYGSYRAFGDAESGPLTSQYIAARGKEGWQSHDISPPRGKPVSTTSGVDLASLDTELKALSPDLCEAWIRTMTDPPLGEGALAGYPNLVRRQDEECGGPAYTVLSSAPWENLPPHDQTEIPFHQELQGLSADGSTATFVAPDSLVGTGSPPPEGGGPRLYAWTAASGPVFACVLPNGEALAGPCTAGSENGNAGCCGRMRSADVQGALSADGQRLFWTAAGVGPGKIYLREHPALGQAGEECSEAAKPCTIAVSQKGEELSGTSKSQFLAAAKDGSRAIFATGEDLYRFDLEGEATTLIAHHVVRSSILGASADASYVYFASTDEMGGQNNEGDSAQAGKPNLYLYHKGEVRFIGTLAAQDISGAASPIEREPRFHLARVSPDGTHAAFMSSAPLTHYDNTDAASLETCGKPKGLCDEEVFLYDATAVGGQGRLICASCNPSGSRPAGATIFVGALPLQAAGEIPAPENTLYATRVLSDDGSRLFFTSSDALVARDTNAQQDVYEWEAAGTGGCSAKSATFSASAQGCIDLISSGQSARSSEFVDASPNGDDVFFTTLSSLQPQDYGLVDVYDARTGGGLPPPPPGIEECEGEGCQSPPGPPEAPTPSSSVIGGSRQLPPSAKAQRCAKGKRQVKRKGKTRCVPRHPSRKGKRRAPR